MVDSAKTDVTQQPQSKWPAENPPTPANKQSWIGTMAMEVFNVCLELYQMFREKASGVNLLPEFLHVIESCICQDTESLAKMSVRVFKEFALQLVHNKKDGILMNLICSRLLHCVVSNLCLDFGEHGFVELIEDTPSNIVDNLSECPLSARRRGKDGDGLRTNDSLSLYPSSEELGWTVRTPYADGKIFEVTISIIDFRNKDDGCSCQMLPEDRYFKISSRRVISLSWGATLYTSEVFPRLVTTETLPERVVSITEGEQLSSAMTAMVISLDIIEVSRDIFKAYFDSWDLCHFALILSGLETSHWHAKSFNENVRLRSRLAKRRFMVFRDDPSRLPHLLDQEVASAQLILEIVFSMYNSAYDHDLIETSSQNLRASDLGRFASGWVER